MDFSKSEWMGQETATRRVFLIDLYINVLSEPEQQQLPDDGVHHSNISHGPGMSRTRE
jgi:hypothetical protein